MGKKKTCWTAERVLEEILKAHEEGEGLGTGQVQRNSLRNAYRANNRNKYFSSWKAAVEAAGIDLDAHRAAEEKAKRKKRKKQLLIDIIAAHERGVSLRASDLQQDPENRNLYERAKGLYQGGRRFWENVLKDAGLDHREITSQKGWDEERVKAAVLERYEAGEPVNAGAIREADSGLHKAGKRCFGSWDKTLRYAGIDPKKVRKSNPRISSQEVIRKIISYHIQGRDLNETKLVKGRSKKLRSLVYAGRRRFGSWSTAVENAGIDYDQFRQRRPWGSWNREKVIEEIKKLDQQGEELNSAHIVENYNDLARAASRYIGSWKKSVEAAGFDYSTIRQNSEPRSTEELKSTIQSLHDIGIDMNPSSMQDNPDKTLRSLYMMSYRRFGSWRKAVEASGIEYSEVCERPHHTDEELESVIKKLHKEGRSLRAIDLQKDPDNVKYYSAIIKRNDGSWYDYLEEIGIDPTPFKENGAAKEKEKQELLDKIQKLHSLGFDISSTGMISNKDLDVRRVIFRSYRVFGNWQNAVEEAGLDYAEIRRTRGEYTLEELTEITLHLQKEGKDLNASAMQQAKDTYNLVQAVTRRDDSWYDFLEEIGINPAPYRKHIRWTPEKVILALRDDYQSGIVRSIWPNNQNLAQATVRHFGSPEEAVKHAGMIYAPKGITKKQLKQDPSIMGKVYKFNKEFLHELAQRAYFMSRRFTRKSLPIEDLEQEALMIFYDNLCTVPTDTGVREYMTKKINSALGKLNREHFRDVGVDEDWKLDRFEEEYGHLA